MSSPKRRRESRKSRELTPTPEEKRIMEETGKAWGAVLDDILEITRQHRPQDAEIIPFSKPQK